MNARQAKSPKRNNFRTLLPLILCLFLSHAAWAARQQNQPPNIVLIVSDDQGYADLGCYGGKAILTPHLDRLASEGIRLTQFYVTWPTCTPSRGSLLTGRYPQRNGTYDMFRNEAPDYGYKYPAEEYAITWERIGGMDTREILIPALLKERGYVSGIFGKWDLGIHRRFLPIARGFDTFYGFVNTGIDYYTHERYGVPSMYRDNSPTEEDKGTYATSLFEREALNFINANKDRPFFLYVPFNAPHNSSNLDPGIRASVQAPQEIIDMYEPDPNEGLRTVTRYGEEAEAPNRSMRRRHFKAAVTCMDQAIGNILKRLEEHQLTDDTIVIFLSDNGGGGGSNNSPLRGGKGRMFEGGVRVPCLIKYPKVIPAGIVSDAFLSTLEIAPTLWHLAGVQSPPQLTLDGFNMLPVLQGAAPSQRTSLFWKRRGDLAARVGDWKWVASKGGNGLFDLKSDVSESKDLSRAQPDQLKTMRAHFSEWLNQMEAAEPRGPFRDY